METYLGRNKERLSDPLGNGCNGEIPNSLLPDSRMNQPDMKIIMDLAIHCYSSQDLVVIHPRLYKTLMGPDSQLPGRWNAVVSKMTWDIAVERVKKFRSRLEGELEIYNKSQPKTMQITFKDIFKYYFPRVTSDNVFILPYGLWYHSIFAIARLDNCNLIGGVVYNSCVWMNPTSADLHITFLSLLMRLLLVPELDWYKEHVPMPAMAFSWKGPNCGCNWNASDFCCQFSHSDCNKFTISYELKMLQERNDDAAKRQESLSVVGCMAVNAISPRITSHSIQMATGFLIFNLLRSGTTFKDMLVNARDYSQFDEWKNYMDFVNDRSFNILASEIDSCLTTIEADVRTPKGASTILFSRLLNNEFLRLEDPNDRRFFDDEITVILMMVVYQTKYVIPHRGFTGDRGFQQIQFVPLIHVPDGKDDVDRVISDKKLSYNYKSSGNLVIPFVLDSRLVVVIKSYASVEKDWKKAREKFTMFSSLSSTSNIKENALFSKIIKSFSSDNTSIVPFTPFVETVLFSVDSNGTAIENLNLHNKTIVYALTKIPFMWTTSSPLDVGKLRKDSNAAPSENPKIGFPTFNTSWLTSLKDFVQIGEISLSSFIGWIHKFVDVCQSNPQN